MDKVEVYHHDAQSKQEVKDFCEPGCSARKLFIHKTHQRRFDILKCYCCWIILKMVKQSLYITENFWISWTKKAGLKKKSAMS